MTLDEEVFSTEVVRIIKTVNFGFGVIVIRDSIWPANSLQDSDNSVYRKTESDWKVRRPRKVFKMALFEKVINMRVVRIVEAHKFGIWAILIGGHMEARRPAQGGRQKLGQIQTESELE